MQTVLPSFLLLTTLLATSSSGQNAAHHDTGVTTRGDQTMGFAHDKTTHHFWLYENGGVIQVEANDPRDTESRDQIRMHLHHISEAFAAGNFKIPMFIHATNPPGAAAMGELRDQIRYQYVETNSGAQVRIRSENPRALKAVHKFLRFQITDHETGDPLTVAADPTHPADSK